mgnify:CR=1 FL=1
MSRIPLYRDFTLPELTRCNNRGLLFDKFCDSWNPDWTLGEQKKQWLSKVAGIAGNANLIADLIGRIQSLAEKLGGRIIFVRTASRFVTGTGNNNPVENGFTWHPTLGTPYLPGTSVKGLAKAWAESEEAKDKSQVWLEDAFGAKESGSGNIIFFDALPLRPVQLAVDVMTPHYSDYYQGSAPPGDWQSPVPIPFLTVDAGQAFMFAFAPRQHNSVSARHLDDIEECLIQALDFSGAGAKTAVGYGQFLVDEGEAEKYKRQREAMLVEECRKQELFAMNPLQRELSADGFDGDTFIAKIDNWIDRAEKAEDADKLEIAQALQAWYEKFRPGYFESPNKKNKARIDHIKSLLNRS